MPDRCQKILVVEPDPDILEILMASLTRRFDAHLTCVVNATACLDVEVTDPHDLVIAELNLQHSDPRVFPARRNADPRDSDGLDLAGKLMTLSAKPIILLADNPTYADAVTAMRLGVGDLFRKPFAVECLLDAVQRLLYGSTLQRQHAAKYQQMRKLVRRVMRERRDLNRRIELICRDVVGAQRRLVHRVLALEGFKSSDSAGV